MSIPFKIIIKENAEELAHAGADLLTVVAQTSVGSRNVFTLAISGGSTPRAMHRLLAQDAYQNFIPWDRAHLFWVDDRCVPFSDEASNYGAALKDFLDKAPIIPDHIHPMPTTLRPAEGASRYQEDLEDLFQPKGKELPRFDLVFLGIGTDGHTASLFPGHEALEEQKRWVVAVKGGDPYISRLTLTLPLINHARQVVFLVSGRGKSEILRTVLCDGKADLPAQRVQPAHGELILLMDRDAASLLPPEFNGGTKLQK